MLDIRNTSGKSKSFSISGEKGLREDIAVFNINGKYQAISDTCEQNCFLNLVKLSQHWFEGSKQSKKEVGQGKFNIKFKEI
jgi:hypothetical protein